MPSYSLDYIAKYIEADLVGDSQYKISGLNTIQAADSAELTFLANPLYKQFLSCTKAGAVIISRSGLSDYSGNALVVDSPYLAYALVSALFNKAPVIAAGIHQTAVIAASAKISKTAAIGPNVVLGENVIIGANCQVGANTTIGDRSTLGNYCKIYSNVSIYHGVTIGSDTIVHSGAVIGADGFGFASNSNHWTKIHQLGGVVIGKRVEIGACTTIDRGALGDTVIEDGVIFDNHVQIAHNVYVGENTAIAGCSGISGSTVVGKNCIFAGQTGVSGHLKICDNVQITGGSIARQSISEPGSYSSGMMLTHTEKWKKNAVRFNELNDLAQRLNALEKKI
ncbi:MAG: UDP-3-O-[3-hydroxymyristoyl] glucosamine N-acyltransferase [Porticoccus sp.]|jgi:UDP-3-O-[3-hydroxymyristoyl] glucosamine N-acyltransferase